MKMGSLMIHIESQEAGRGEEMYQTIPDLPSAKGRPPMAGPTAAVRQLPGLGRPGA